MLNEESDFAFCVRCLEAVSRSFSLPISMFQSPLRESVTCAYLFCRIIDTIEDDSSLSSDARSLLYKSFLDFLREKISEQTWLQNIAPIKGSPMEIILAQGMGRVLRTLSSVPDAMQQVCFQWIAEMCRGMEIYSCRPKGNDGIRALLDLNDLDRYCYFVAGTVGHLLTELFTLDSPQILHGDIQQILQRNAESFGVGLQLVNIVKDIASDRKNGVSFIPRSLGIFDLEKPKDAHRILAPIFEKAYQNLDAAMEYILAIPPQLKSIRMFLLLPLWMAVPTLQRLYGNDAIFDANARVVISWDDVQSIVHECELHCQDDAALRRIYSAMRLKDLTPSPS